MTWVPTQLPRGCCIFRSITVTNAYLILYLKLQWTRQHGTYLFTRSFKTSILSCGTDVAHVSCILVAGTRCLRGNGTHDATYFRLWQDNTYHCVSLITKADRIAPERANTGMTSPLMTNRILRSDWCCSPGAGLTWGINRLAKLAKPLCTVWLRAGS